jgi:hypothetical protein
VESDAELHPNVPDCVIGILTLVIDAPSGSFPNMHEFIMDMRSLAAGQVSRRA